MNDNQRVLVVGAGNMAKEYCKVLDALRYEPLVIGRGKESAAKLENEMRVNVLRGGIEKNIGEIHNIPEYAVVACSVEELAHSTRVLLENDVKNILVEKPAALYRRDLEEIEALTREKKANVYVAYNRRFYASTEEAQRIIAKDGGVLSFSFEFTEWGHDIKKTSHSNEVKENWFLANSSHVVDLAFYLGGFPREMSCYIAGSLDWHKRAGIYAGAGVSEQGALFSYQANWGAPGRWAVEVLTAHHRLYFKPMEKLQIQEMGTVAVNFAELDDRLDITYKPGIYKQMESFLNGKPDGKKLSISEQMAHMTFYEKIEKIGDNDK